MSIKALIAVRSGSLRVKNKNIRDFAGSTLLDIKIQQLLKIDALDGIIVNSNDDEILAIAGQYNVDLVKRDDKYASNEVSMSEVYEDMANNFSADHIMYSNVTNPLISTQSIIQMIELYEKGGVFDSINSVHAIKEFLYRDGKALNYDPLNQPRSQDLPNIQAINFAISLIAKKDMIKYKNVVGHQPRLFEIGEIEAVDIDTLLDFKIADYLYQEMINEKK